MKLVMRDAKGVTVKSENDSVEIELLEDEYEIVANGVRYEDKLANAKRILANCESKTDANTLAYVRNFPEAEFGLAMHLERDLKPSLDKEQESLRKYLNGFKSNTYRIKTKEKDRCAVMPSLLAMKLRESLSLNFSFPLITLTDVNGEEFKTEGIVEVTLLKEGVA